MARRSSFFHPQLVLAAAIGTAIGAATTIGYANAATRPNIVLILADDMGIDSVSASNDKMGLKTPNLDRLARAGISFTDAHSTSAVCSPTRYSLLTGRYSWRSRLKRGIVGQWESPLIEDERLTLPEMLRQQGYATICIGKWHLGWDWPKQGGGTTEQLEQIDFTAPIKGGPNDHGFGYYFGDDVPNWPPYIWRENQHLLGTIATTMKQGALRGVSAGPAVEGWDFTAVLPEYARRCAEAIGQRGDREEPFFLYFPMPSPHTPIAPNGDFIGSTSAGAYADFLIETDWAVGELLRALDQTGLTKNTLLIFTGDNGTSPEARFPELRTAGVRLNEHWRGWKADAYEGGHRVPLIVRWPGHIREGASCDQTVTLADIMATCAEVVGHKLSANAAEDSVSLLPLLLGQEVQGSLHNAVVHHSASGHFAVRSGPWKVLFCRGSGGWSPPREREAEKMGLPPLQLYNLQRDPKETKNLQGEHPELVAELTRTLRHMVEQGRSTPGPKQPNDAAAAWWPGLPWEEP
jgi:arylsulfatase A